MYLSNSASSAIHRHPELLDTLAVRFMEAGWSLRWLHREIMLSTAYQLASTNEPANVERDPENLFVWRYAPRRLDFEAWRDAWLAVAGRLDARPGGPSIELTQGDNVRRTLYAKVSRLEPNKLLVLFDFPDANVTSDRRSVTTVPQQQLFALNSEFAIETAKAFAKRLAKTAAKDEERIALALRLAYGREPTPAEMRASVEFVRDARTRDRLTPWEQFAQAILASNEFLWVDYRRWAACLSLSIEQPDLSRIRAGGPPVHHEGETIKRINRTTACPTGLFPRLSFCDIMAGPSHELCWT